jgi:hypothetical protein
MRISNSFSEGEIQVMDFIVQTLLRGGSPTMAVRNKDFASLCRKIQTMKTRVNEKQIADELGATAVETTVSVAEPEPAPLCPTETIRPAEPMQQAV